MHTPLTKDEVGAEYARLTEQYGLASTSQCQQLVFRRAKKIDPGFTKVRQDSRVDTLL